MKKTENYGNPKIAEFGLATRFKPGNKANPCGRPKTKPLAERYKELLEQEVPGDAEGRTHGDLIVLAVFKEAMAGNIRAAAEIAARVEGKAIQSMEITKPDVLANNLKQADEELLAILKEARIKGFVFSGPKRKIGPRKSTRNACPVIDQLMTFIALESELRAATF